MQTVETDPRKPGWVRVVLIGRSPKWTLIRIVVLVAIVLIVRSYVLIPIQVIGPSMLPHFQDHGVNFVNRLAYRKSQPARGDVVAIRMAGTSIMYMKRIVALPGETIEFRNGRILINGKVLDESYMDFTRYPCDWDIPPESLGPDRYYVVGDNRTMPEYLHVKGETSRDRIVGRILLCKNLFASSSLQH
jgi:signal peptidase I